ncbi:MAG: RnfABCDGE type electron transport complex subunit B [Rhodocyclaceae bacterium]|nr:MAG: RnfABCDGE type electron transport complex subunit B [Rhodocyclaceae bacterium]
MTEPAIDPLAVCIDAIYGVAKTPAMAFIDEATCIGCALCIQACPVDAIVGAAKQMHTVVAAWCTGCELCLPPCPVDCIRMLPLSQQTEDPQAAGDRARRRYEFQLRRRAREQRERAERLAAKAATLQLKAAAETKQALIAAAIARARKLNAR